MKVSKPFEMGSSPLRTLFCVLIILSYGIHRTLQQTEKDFDFEDEEELKKSDVTLFDDEDFQKDDANVEGSAEGSGLPTDSPDVLPKYPEFFRVTINFTSIPWRHEYADISNTHSQQLISKLSVVIEQLFANLPGQRLVNIIELREGSTIVKFDLGTQGYYDRMMLYNVLLEALNQGSIGPYSVSPEGFMFMPLGETACPEFVGREPKRIQGKGGDNFANLMVNNIFPCDGFVTGWEYYRTNSYGTGFVGVFKHVSDDEFVLLQKTELPPAPIGLVRIQLPESFYVEKGDFMGIFYPHNAEEGVVDYTSAAENILPVNELYQNYYVRLYDRTLQKGIAFNKNDYPATLRSATFSMRALLDYAGVTSAPIIPTPAPTTCGPDQYTCNDGSCVPGAYRCDRQPDCLDESDEKNCVYVCQENQFQCKNGDCIYSEDVCNGVNDCPDGDDEISCQPEVPCTNTEFQCGNGQCISEDLTCDGDEDCRDGSDEDKELCAIVTDLCPEGQYRCENRQCIDPNLRCDGKYDCADRTDEYGCVACSASEFECDNKQCISQLQRCDGNLDCNDGSDERSCPIFTCPEGEFHCPGSRRCMAASRKCDNIQDCPDGFDEDGCEAEACFPGEFKCRDGTCIRDTFRCDGIPDCPDNSDEDRCDECRPGEFTCTDRSCISSSERCDGIPNCVDGLDEKNCDSCQHGQFHCQDRTCIDAALKCNDLPDCPDSSDEVGCPVACPDFIGRLPERIQGRGGDNYANLMITNQFICDGYITGWEYYRVVPYGIGYAAVFRRINDNEYAIIHKTELPESAIGRIRIDLPSRLFVQNGDFIGIFYPRTSEEGVVDYASVSDDLVPQAELFENYYIQIYNDSLGDGGRFDIRRYPNTKGMRTYAIRAIMNYETCRLDEYQCSSGECLPRYLTCNGIENCRDGSDEAASYCVPSCPDGDFQCADLSCIDLRLKCDGYPDCPDSSDESLETCPPRACTSNEFTCSNRQCIDISFKCNGVPDCSDESDEAGCTPKLCFENQFQCGTGHCLELSRRCDNYNDCPDGSDEKGCPFRCESNEFKCHGVDRCVPQSSVCDRRRDCEDGSDEFECPFQCQSGQFKCTSTDHCLPATSVCDKNQDCSDGSDEFYCPTVNVSPTDFRIREGQSVTFYCRVTGDPPPTFTWTLNGRALPQRAVVDRDRLTIDSVSRSEAGDYVCTVEGYGGRYFATSRLIVDSACRNDQWQCSDRSCIDERTRCDGYKNCRDGSDESGCTFCRNEQFLCNEGTCIDKSMRCNGVPECRDRSDEHNCPKVCSEFVGRLPESIQNKGGDNYANLMYGNPFPCDGWLTAWEYYRVIPYGVAYASVWRKVGDDQYILVHTTELPEAEVGLVRVDLPRRVFVREGDIIGIYYPQDVEEGVIDFAREEDNLVPDYELHDTYYVAKYNATIRINVPVNLREEVHSKTKRTYAIRGILSYESFQCQPGEFKCLSDDQCIHPSQRCDRRYDCYDGSDERDCPFVCRSGEFKCLSVDQCVPQSSVCNRRRECHDGSDERNCRPHECEDHEFKCRTGDQCVARTSRCDRRFDCQDQSDEEDCGTDCSTQKADIVVVIDSSTSVTEGNFVKVKEFVVNFLEPASIDNGNVRIGLVMYSTDVHIDFYMDNFTNKAEMFDAIKSLPYRHGSTNTAGGLRAMRTQVFQQARGDRLDVPNIAVVITDGVSNIDYLETIPEADRAREAGIHVYAVGIGLADTQELYGIANKPASENSFSVQDFSALEDLDEKIFASICPEHTCLDDEFKCRTGDQCVPARARCDRKYDCNDGSDEAGCALVCEDHEFKCRSGDQCVARTSRCDRRFDCQDQSDEEDCGTDCSTQKADIVVVIDSSTSVTEGNFVKVKEFVVNFLEPASIDNGNVRIGLVMYSTDVHIDFYMDNFTNKAEMFDAIKSLPYRHGSTNTAGGLRAMRTQVFQQARGDRLDVPNIAVVITDGVSNIDYLETIPEADRAREAGIHVYAVGIGLADTQELYGIANKPASENSFSVQDFSALEDLDEKIFASICPEHTCSGDEFKCRTGDQCVPARARCDRKYDCNDGSDEADCGQDCSTSKADIVVVIDSSTSVTEGNFVKVKEFVVNFLEPASIDNGNVRVGLVMYSTDVHIDFYMDNFTSKAEMFDAIRSLPYRHGSTNTAGGLRAMRTQVFQQARGDRPNVPNIAIVITDGVSNIDYLETIPEADRAREAKIHVYAIGIGLADTQELYGIANKPHSENSFSVQDFAALEDLDEKIFASICPPAFTCEPDQFKCKNVNQCVRQSAVCDRRYDCSDRSDEADCEVECRADEFKCRSGDQCIPIADHCNRRYDCRDGSDETECSKNCSTSEVDLVVVIDSSTSVTEDNFIKVKQFVVNFLEPASIDNGNVRVGLVMYSTDVHIDFYMDNFTNKAEMFDAIKSLPYRHGSTNTAGGLRAMRMQVFQPERGDRPDIPNVALVITDGVSNIDYLETIPEADLAREADIHLYAVGIGLADTVELYGIANKPATENSFSVQDFAALDDLDDKIFATICPVFKCESGQFKCLGVNQCIYQSSVCDRREDCSDGSDELDCPFYCKDDEFQCRTVDQCVPKSSRCDGRYDCHDRTDEEGCGGDCSTAKVDLVVVIDSSTSVTEKNFVKVKQFVVDILNPAQIDNGNVRVGLVMYSTEVFVEFYMNNFTKKADMLEAILNLPYRHGATNTAGALRVMRTKVFQPEQGDRPDVPNTAVVITDGISNVDYLDTVPEANNARDVNIHIFAVGIGLSDTKELYGIANDPASENSFSVQDFAALGDLDEKIFASICPPSAFKCEQGYFKCLTRDQCVPQSQVCDKRNDCLDATDESDCPFDCREDEYRCRTIDQCISRAQFCDGRRDCSDGSDEERCVVTPAPVKPDCTSSEVDIVVVVDSSTSVTEANFDKVKNFIINFMDPADIDGGKVRIGFVMYSTDVHIDFHLNTYATKAAVKDKILSLPYRHGSTNTAGGLKTMRTELFTVENGDRPAVPNVAIVVTDGVSNINYLETIPEADRAREAGIKMYAIGIGLSDTFEIVGIADKPAEENSFYVEDFNALEDLEKKIFDSICPVFRCNSDEFRCLTVNECVPKTSVCDERFDCSDRTDERDCELRCDANQFRCDSVDQCVSQESVCDGRNDCQDGSDERSCPSVRVTPKDLRILEGRTATFYCQISNTRSTQVTWTRRDRRPLPLRSQVVNDRLTITEATPGDSGEYVCSLDGHAGRVTDFGQLNVEQEGPCGRDQVSCSNGQCIPRDYRCDGERDCTDGSDETDEFCDQPSGPCEPNEFRCNDGACKMKIWQCDGEKDCGDGSDEAFCPTGPIGVCTNLEFQCASGDQCVPLSYQCDGEVDCQDGADERACSPPVVTLPPDPDVSVNEGGEFTIVCEAVGVPTPLIVWRLNWGNIPTGARVETVSEDGKGRLTIRNVAITDAGAYTCEAINTKGTIFAVPDAIVVVKAYKTECEPGYFNDAARSSQDCIRCFCFGQSVSCRSNPYYISQILIGRDIELVERDMSPADNARVDYDDRSRQFAVANYDSLPQHSHYWSLPQQFLRERLLSYGGQLKYSVYYDTSRSQRPTNAPDIIITGNGITLFYRNPTPPSPSEETDVTVRFVPTSWHKNEHWTTTVPNYATRNDIMMVLQNVTSLLIRAVYDESQTTTRVKNIIMETSIPTETPFGRTNHIELCQCSPGYDGHSCQRCASGHYRRRTGSYLGECVPCRCNGHSQQCDPETGECLDCLHNTHGPYCGICNTGYYGDATRGTPSDCKACPCPLTSYRNQFSKTCVLDEDGDVTCTQCPEGYEGRRCDRCSRGYSGNPLLEGDYCRKGTDLLCDPRGSTSTQPDPITGRCSCKTNVEGPSCSKCKEDTFYLSDSYPYGCINCFCSGVSQRCFSTSLQRTRIYTAFTSDRSGFGLTDLQREEKINTDFTVDRNSRELVYRNFNSLPEDVYYWSLPSRFLGNKVSSYGGNLRFGIRYRAGFDSSTTEHPLVEIIGNGFTLLHVPNVEIEQNKVNSFSVPFFESEWINMDGTPTSREFLLMTLADLEAVLIRATFTKDTIDAGIQDVSMDIAESRDTQEGRALAVEQCNCPIGYKGLSCEDCDAGYTRTGGGLYLGLCERCQCNGHSSDCDPETGICKRCQHGTEGDHCERCAPGYYGVATRGTPNDCQKCPCPLTESPNQFSTTCRLATDGQVTCTACPVGHTGRRCERCADGYEGNPMIPNDYCKTGGPKCSCDGRGTVPNTQCDPVSNQCVCKNNVQGLQCNRCKEGHFYLSKDSDMGCLSCFCMGVTEKCSSSGYHKDIIRPLIASDGTHNFVLTNRRLSNTITDGFVVNPERNSVTFRSFEGIQKERESLFFNLPPKFRGDQVASYGGVLKFILEYTADEDAGTRYMDVDIELINGNSRMYILLDPSATPNEEHAYEIPLLENKFRSLDGSSPTREKFLTMLANVNAILIRATHHKAMKSITLRDVSLETATSEVTNLGSTPWVESCQCPEGYTGLSCQKCAPGYLRTEDTGTAVGRCLKCSCNGHAASCDPETGRCLNCQDNTDGDRCERCVAGFYGDATVGTPNDCRRCPCPLTIPSNQFSPTCSLERDGSVTCDRCPPGYSGRDCGTCAAGYSGNPREPGGTCRKEDGERPSVTVTPVRLRVPRGETATFQCNVQSRTRFNVVWSRTDGRRMPSNTRTGARYELTVSNAVSRDAGGYVCTATNQFGSARSYTELEVVSAENIQVDIDEPPQVTADIGQTVRFVCTVINTPRQIASYVISWSKIDGLLPSRAIDQNGVLVLPNVQASDAGTYVCTGSDKISTDTDTVQLIIEDSETPTVRIEPRYLNVNYGDSVEFRCIATGRPTPTVEWYRDGRVDFNPAASFVDGILRIPSATSDDQGQYYCKATSSSGTSETRTVLYVSGSAPEVEIIIKDTQVLAIAGENVRLECYAKDVVDATLVWSRRDGTLPPGSRQDGGTLIIPNIQQAYAGTYICSGTTPTGARGTASAVVGIEREKTTIPTATIEPRTQIVKSGTTGIIKCVVSGIPKPKVTWKRARGELSPNHQVVGETLRINQASMKDRDIYVCTAENAAGSAMASVMVDVQELEMPAIELFPAPTKALRPGGSAWIQCRVSKGIPAPTISWSRANDEEFTASTKVMEGNGVIMWESASADDQGAYICTATNEAGSVTATATVTVKGPPKVTIAPSKLVTTVIGQRVTIECTGEGDPVPSVEWRGRPQESRGDIPITEYDLAASGLGSAVLTFERIQRTDAGTYICVARNEGGTTEDRVQVTVNEGPRPEETGVVISGPSRLNVVEGQNVELVCTARGLAQPSLHWRRREGILPPEHSVENGILVIPSIQSQYGGEYICVARTPTQTFESSVFILIGVTPRLIISPQDVTARAGETLRLTCRSEGSGPHSYEWNKVDGRLSPAAVERDGILEIPSITAADSGRYRCTVSSPIGTSDAYARVTVLVPPTVQVSPKQDRRPAGTTVQFRCSATGVPKPTIRWDKQNGGLPAQHQVRDGTLILYNVQKEDEGRYICTATNEAASARDYTYLQVSDDRDNGPTTEIVAEKSVVEVGDRVELNCIATGTPKPTVTWDKLEGALPAGSFIDGTQLIIPQVRPEDAGTYRCTATNQAGTIHRQAQLFVRAVPTLRIPNDITTASLGTSASLGCQAQGYPQPVITWNKRGGDLPIDHSIVNGDLYIPRVRYEDRGTYDCRAQNIHGAADDSAELVVGELVPYFPQNPKSYISYPPLHDAYMNFDILVSFKPEATDGLVLYNGQFEDGSGDFLCFGLSDSVPEFRFNVGSGPAIIRGNKSLDMNQWHTVHLKRDRKQGTLIVDDQPFHGESAGNFQGLDVSDSFYLGGLPDFSRYPRTMGFRDGFVGSVSQLKLQGVPVNIGGDARSLVGIEPYLVCRHNPCRNDGRCLPANNAVGFQCECPAGFSGDACEVSGRTCAPGSCGRYGKCRQFGHDIRCSCPVGYSGAGCYTFTPIVDPAFNKNSFIAYEKIEKALMSLSLDMVFKLNTLDDGLILYNGQHANGTGDFIALLVKDRHLELRFDTGSGPAVITSRNPVTVGKWITIRAVRDGRDGSLVVDNEEPVRARLPNYYIRQYYFFRSGSTVGSTVGLNLQQYLYLGGVDQLVQRVSSSVEIADGFSGCIAEVRINDKDLDIIKDAVESYGIKDCGDRNMCDKRPCENGGHCESLTLTEYSCVCGEDFTGRNCETRIDYCLTNKPCQNGGICSVTNNEYKCDCPVGFTGQDCQEAIYVNQEFEVRGDGFVVFDSNLLPQRTSSLETISFKLKTTEYNGLIFWLGQNPTVELGSSDFFAIGIANGTIEVRYELGSGPAHLRSETLVDDGFEHTVRVSRQGRSGRLLVDKEEVTGESAGVLQMLNAKSNIYIGGVNDLAKMTGGIYKSNFNGCVIDVVIEEKGPLLVSRDAVGGYNVRPCIM